MLSMVKRISQDEDFLNLLPSKWWVKFFQKFDEIEGLPTSKWQPIHYLSHITKRYEEVFGKHFSFAIKGTPSKCAEIFMTKQIMAVLGTSNPHTIKGYIDWVFDSKIINGNRKFRSIGFFANPAFCNEYNLLQIEKNKITRSTCLPSEYKIIIDVFNLPIYTYGDLAFVKCALDEDSNNESRLVYQELFKELYRVGFEFNMLDNIK